MQVRERLGGSALRVSLDVFLIFSSGGPNGGTGPFLFLLLSLYLSLQRVTVSLYLSLSLCLSLLSLELSLSLSGFTSLVPKVLPYSLLPDAKTHIRAGTHAKSTPLSVFASETLRPSPCMRVPMQNEQPSVSLLAKPLDRPPVPLYPFKIDFL